MQAALNYTALAACIASQLQAFPLKDPSRTFETALPGRSFGTGFPAAMAFARASALRLPYVCWASLLWSGTAGLLYVAKM